MRLRTPDHCTSITLIGEKVELVQDCFTLHSRNQQSKWMQDGCKVYMVSYVASNGSCFVVTSTISQNHELEIGLTRIRETMALQNLTIVIAFYHVRGSYMSKNSLKQHLVLGPVTYDFTLHLRARDHTTRFWRCVGTAFGHFLFGLSQFHGHALGSCVNWPLHLHEERGGTFLICGS